MVKKVRTHELRHIVAVSNNKGGAGKTSTVLNLASAITRRKEGYRVLVIDCDPQHNLSQLLKWQDQFELDGNPTIFNALCNQQGLPVYRAQDGLYFTPASMKLNGIDVFLSQLPNPNKAMQELLDRSIDDRTTTMLGDTIGEEKSVLSSTLAGSFDFIFLDTQPAMSRMTYNALYAADGLIITTELEETSISGMVNVAVAAGRVIADTKRLTIQGILITKSDARLRIAKHYEPQIRKLFCETFSTVIRQSKDISESRALHEDVFTSYAGGRAAQDFEALADEYLKKFA